MSTRLWLLALPLVAAALILALLLGGEDDESVSGPHAVASPSANGAVLPDAPASLPNAVGLRPDTRTDPNVADVASILPAADDDRVYGVIAGKLIDPAGKPVPGEPVLLLLASDGFSNDEDPDVPGSGGHDRLLARTSTDPEGRFVVPALGGRSHTVLAGGGAWPVATVERVAAGEVLLVSLAQGYVVEGRVVEEPSGLPVAGARVMVMGGGSEILGATDDDGRFALGPAPADDVAVGAYAEGYDVVLQAIAPALGPVTIEMPPARPLAGRLVERGTGEPVGPGRVHWFIDVEQPSPDATPAAGPGGPADAPAWERLVIEERDVETDADGRFDLGPGPSFGFVIEAEAEGFVHERFDRHDIRRLGPDQEIVVALTRATAWTGHATLADGGAPAAGAVVEASGPRGPVSRSVVGADGSFALPMSGWDGQRPVRVTATDDVGRTAVARVRRDTDPLDLRLAEPLALTVAVVEGDVPLPGAEVAVEGGEAATTLGRTGADGTVVLSHPSVQDLDGVTVRARHGARVTSSEWVELPRADSEAPVVLDLLDGVSIEGVVVDPYGTPIVGAEVAVMTGPFGHSVADGAFALAPVELGEEGRLDVDADGFHRRRVPFIGGDPPLRVVLDPLLSFRGRAVDLATGLPLDAMTIALQSEQMVRGERAFQRVGGARVKRSAPGTGEFAVELPEPGRYRVQVSSREHVTSSSLSFDFQGAVEPPFQEIALPRAARLEITMLDGRLRPVTGLAVTAMGMGLDGEPDRRDRHSARTDDLGVARLNLGDGGIFRVSASRAGPLDDGVAVPAGVVVQRSFRTPPSGEIQVSVVDADGATTSDCRVQVRSLSEGNDWSISRRTRLRAPATSVVVDRLPPGDYRVFASRRGSAPGSARVTVVPDRAVPVTVALDAPDDDARDQEGQDRALLQQLGYLGGGAGRRRER